MPSSGGTDLEAQFRLRLFALLGSSSALRQLVQSRSSSASSARLDLARFLAAYYLGINFARIFERLNRCHQVEAVPSGGMATVLPNLMICAEMDEVEENIECHADRLSSSPSSSSVWERSRLGQLLPCECTPNFALTLLLREQRCMEAVFFADHFHNSRTSMALRFLVDRHFAGLSLLAPYCRVTLIDQLLDVIELGEFDGDEKRIHQLIEAVIQADVLFHEEFGSCSLLNECLKAIASKMGDQFGELLHELEVAVAVDEHHHSVAALQTPSIDTVKRVALLLPRPPIYCSSFELGMPLSARHNDADTETRAWAVLHACCTALVHALARSNRLEQLIGFFALWVGRHNESTKSDVPFLLEAEFFTSGHSDAELAVELDAFQTLLSIALAMEIRDKFMRRLAESLEVAANEAQNANLANFDDVIRNCRDKLCALAPPFCDDPDKMQQKQQDPQLVWPNLKR
uniref:Uncharacterized protein n=1 Tax=Globodera rostochiensis TaxID=31243 RepID=A0A914HGD1_GLORO